MASNNLKTTFLQRFCTQRAHQHHFSMGIFQHFIYPPPCRSPANGRIYHTSVLTVYARFLFMNELLQLLKFALSFLVCTRVETLVTFTKTFVAFFSQKKSCCIFYVNEAKRLVCRICGLSYDHLDSYLHKYTYFSKVMCVHLWNLLMYIGCFN